MGLTIIAKESAGVFVVVAVFAHALALRIDAGAAASARRPDPKLLVAALKLLRWRRARHRHERVNAGLQACRMRARSGALRSGGTPAVAPTSCIARYLRSNRAWRRSARRCSDSSAPRSLATERCSRSASCEACARTGLSACDAAGRRATGDGRRPARAGVAGVCSARRTHLLSLLNVSHVPLQLARRLGVRCIGHDALAPKRLDAVAQGSAARQRHADLRVREGRRELDDQKHSQTGAGLHPL